MYITKQGSMVHKFSYKLPSAGRGYPKVAEWILAMVFVLIVLISRINVSEYFC